jgi:hypothetical protein
LGIGLRERDRGAKSRMMTVFMSFRTGNTGRLITNNRMGRDKKHTEGTLNLSSLSLGRSTCRTKHQKSYLESRNIFGRQYMVTKIIAMKITSRETVRRQPREKW